MTCRSCYSLLPLSGRVECDLFVKRSFKTYELAGAQLDMLREIWTNGWLAGKQEAEHSFMVTGSTTCQPDEKGDL